jgi:hypothetical protein
MQVSGDAACLLWMLGAVYSHISFTFLLRAVCVAALQAELPDLLEALDGVSSASVPEGLLREIDEVNSIGGAQHLQEVCEGL